MSLKASIISLSILLGVIIAPNFVDGSPATNHKDTKKEATKEAYHTIHTKELKNWIDSGKPIQIVDARPKKYDKGEVIIGAKFLPFDSTEAKITATLPDKDAVIVVYCASIKCPASSNLAQKLVSMGYTHIYKYPEGIAEWMDKDYPLAEPKS